MKNDLLRLHLCFRGVLGRYRCDSSGFQVHMVLNSFLITKSFLSSLSTLHILRNDLPMEVSND